MNQHDMAVNAITAILDKAEPLMTDDCCIYKVPFAIRRLNDDTYTPKVISIGPFHHRHHHHPRLENMERHKLIYFKMLLLLYSNTSLLTLIQYIDSILPNFRGCYSETLDFTDQELLELILIDSGFIIGLFRKSYYHDWSEHDALLLSPWLSYNIRLDLLLLENQLPFFVLEKIYNICFSARTNIPSFLELTFRYFNGYNKSNLVYNNSHIRIRHFTDLIRIFHLQLEKGPPRTHVRTKHLHSVTELFEAGVSFKVNTNTKCLLDLRFSDGVFEIPQLRVDGWTEILFRNMIALEQCHYPHESYITDYFVVLDFLISTGRDVDILVQKGILVDWLGDSDSVAKMFNSLCKNIISVNFSPDYSVICDNLDGFYRDPWHKLKATLRRDYCSSPWQTAASVAGILLLFISLLQSVCSVLQVVQQ